MVAGEDGSNIWIQEFIAERTVFGMAEGGAKDAFEMDLES